MFSKQAHQTHSHVKVRKTLLQTLDDPPHSYNKIWANSWSIHIDFTLSLLKPKHPCLLQVSCLMQ